MAQNMKILPIYATFLENFMKAVLDATRLDNFR